MLRFALRHKQSVIISAVVLFTSSAFVFGKMGGEFIPELDEGDIAMQTFLRPGSSLSETIKREKEVETLLLKSFPEIKRYVHVLALLIFLQIQWASTIPIVSLF